KSLPSPDIAYMIYTSGSTGKPKGVMIGHKGLTNYIHSTTIINGLLPSDKISAYRSFSFDSHIEEFYPTLSIGATVFVMPEDIRHDTEMLYEYLQENHITGCYFPTALASLLYDSYELPVRFIGAVGERLVNVVSGKNGVQFINTYGPTECTDHISVLKLEDSKVYDKIPIGRPLHNGQVFVIDNRGHLVPEGCTGELCFSSIQLALGYWNNPELTAERFVDITIGGKTFKIYKTGDLCRWNADGQLEYIGRIDNQVKLRGFRIELGEIESAALQIECVQQAVAMIRNERIVLYYTQSGANDENTDAMNSRLTEALSSSLPEYMVPSCYVRLDTMPLTTNGKIDRRALPEPELVQENYVAPESRNEKLLCKFVEELLGVEQIGITDSFRRLGMSSIQAMKLNMELHKINIHLNIGAILKADNVKNACRYIDEGIDTSGVGSWMDEYDKSKPTIVLCCGVISAEKIYKNMTTWKEEFNVYILQPIFNAWSDIEQISNEEIVSRYLEVLKRDVEGGISCILGFSYGGELAYHLALRWELFSSKKPMVIMGDTHIVQPRLKIEEIRNRYENEQEAYYLELYEEFFSKRERLPISGYDGQVILISALQDSPHREENEREWQQHNGNIRIIPKDDTHQGLFEHPEHYDNYFNLILGAY
ncbi:MAG: non-ribosomal peptide synthetase, partial [Bacteroidales bacterium]|nr:non-ribosomal peptide synthetase [Bacteroidales bacterium]